MSAPYGYTTITKSSFQDPTDTLRWTPWGWTQTALDIPNEPLRTFSPYGVRGSQKYPFGKAYLDPWEIDGWGDDTTSTNIDFISSRAMSLMLGASLICLSYCLFTCNSCK